MQLIKAAQDQIGTAIFAVGVGWAVYEKIDKRLQKQRYSNALAQVIARQDCIPFVLHTLAEPGVELSKTAILEAAPILRKRFRPENSRPPEIAYTRSLEILSNAGLVELLPTGEYRVTPMGKEINEEVWTVVMHLRTAASAPNTDSGLL